MGGQNIDVMKQRMTSTVLGLCLLGLQPGCAGSVTWHTEQRVVLAGHDVVVRYKNASVYKAWGDLNANWFERLCGSGWRFVEKQEDDNLRLLVLRSILGREFDVDVPVDLDIPTGTYRIVTEIEVGGHHRRLETNPFVVTAADGVSRAGDPCDTAAQRQAVSPTGESLE
jgi:hypothetical protein